MILADSLLNGRIKILLILVSVVLAALNTSVYEAGAQQGGAATGGDASSGGTIFHCTSEGACTITQSPRGGDATGGDASTSPPAESPSYTEEAPTGNESMTVLDSTAGEIISTSDGEACWESDVTVTHIPYVCPSGYTQCNSGFEGMSRDGISIPEGMMLCYAQVPAHMDDNSDGIRDTFEHEEACMVDILKC